MNINLKLLQTFLLVAEHSSFNKAADQSHRSTLAVSMQIKQLEAQLGLTLFRRTTRRVELTKEGTQLLASTRKALGEMDVCLRELREALDFKNARLVVSCIPSVASTRLPSILAEFSKEYPRVTVHVRELGGKEMQESVRKEDIDFSVGAKPSRMSGLKFKFILDDEYYALVDPGFLPKRRTGLTLKELASLPVLGLGSPFREDVNQAARELGIEFRTHYEIMQISTMVAMAERGLGVALLPGISIPAHTWLKPLRIIDPVIRREIGIISARGRPLSPVASRFAEIIERQLHSEPSTDARAVRPLVFTVT